MAAARAAGCPVWCVPYGYNEGLRVETLDCDRIVATLSEAAQLIAAMRSNLNYECAQPSPQRS